jgi:hypothetical protein
MVAQNAPAPFRVLLLPMAHSRFSTNARLYHLLRRNAIGDANLSQL